MDQPEIAAGGWLLRPWRRSDAEWLVGAWADPEILRWSRYGAVAPNRENIEQWLDWNHDQWQFGLRVGYAVCSLGDGALAGSVMLRDWARSESAETGYWVVPPWRGRGAAPAALNALSEWSFTPQNRGGLGLRRIALRHSVRNAASCRVAEKAGFRCEGTMRESLRYADGDWHDEHLHGRLAGDPPVEGSNAAA
jgi:RimJ/RimL family protein N-acetyltransferase